LAGLIDSRQVLLQILDFLTPKLKFFSKKNVCGFPNFSNLLEELQNSTIFAQLDLE